MKTLRMEVFQKGTSKMILPQWVEQELVSQLVCFKPFCIDFDIL